MGSIFFNFARGKDNRPVEAFHERKSVGCEETYLENLNKESQVVIALYHLVIELVVRIDKAKI